MITGDISWFEEEWRSSFSDATDRIAKLFRRKDAFGNAVDYLRGLLSNVDRKNGWQLAESVGKATPFSTQHLLSRCKWDASALRDELQSFVKDELSASDGVLILDETGFLKKGVHSAGVQRQYSGTAGRIENCQVGVFLAYSSSQGRTFIDRELYLPKSWIDDQARCSKAGVPEDITFATKPQLGIKMLERAFASKLQIAWVTGDTVYGNDYKLRNFLAQRHQPYVLMVPNNHKVFSGFQSHSLQELAQSDSLFWQPMSCGGGSKGERHYDWALYPLQYDAPKSMQYAILLRRGLKNEKELSFYIVLMPQNTPLQEIVNVAGRRWAIEECFQSAKGEVGLDEYEVRTWHGWYRHITLALFAHAYLSIQAARNSLKKKQSGRGSDSSICARDSSSHISILALGIPPIKKHDISLVVLAKTASAYCEKKPL